MHRLLAAALTCVVAASLAAGTALGIVAALHATPEQPNVPLVHFHSSPREAGETGPSREPDPSGSPGAPGKPEPSEKTGSPVRSGSPGRGGAAEERP
ncbi:hypothetical protein [Streptomyces sp. JJ36]|uniref:hypothetical protein n=1 Tax=Streptomyces sp. JJ36 TaxID=2736645 RepID=UPI001F1E3C3D|nr:hypothetical protein [Streptomyces sp. JJ36]MCF6524764.1 hypothetical protein [Streptomyces sp. JJ36]